MEQQRMKYYSALKTLPHMANRKSFLALPTQVLDESYYLQDLPFDKDAETGKHGSLTNIFSCWNGMVGTGLVTIPWAYSQSGIILGLLLTVLAFAISFTTQYYIMKTAGNDLDYTDTLKKTFGRRGWYFGMILFIIMLTIPIIILFQLLAQFLYPIILVCIELFTKEDRHIDFAIDFSHFSYSYTCFIIFGILWLLTARRDLRIFVKINMYGVIFTIIIIIFIISTGIYALCVSEYDYQNFTDEEFKPNLTTDS